MRPGQVRRGGIGAGVAFVALLVGVVVGNVSPAGATHLGVLALGHVQFAPGATSLTSTAVTGDGSALILTASNTDATTFQDGLFSVGYDEGDGVDGQGTGTGYGVHGRNLTDGGTGVFGEGDAGVWGQSDRQFFTGVYGENLAVGGFGVAGRAEDGTGVLADSDNGTALLVQGVTTFTRSGLVIAGAGQTSRGVTGISVTTASLVLTSIQGNNTANMYVTRVVTIPSQSKFVIYFNQAVPAGTTLKIAWMVLN
jgi:hypothetical protein